MPSTRVRHLSLDSKESYDVGQHQHAHYRASCQLTLAAATQYDPRPRDIVTVHRRSALCEAVGGTLHSGKCGNLKQEGRPKHQTGEGGAYYPPHQRLDIRAHGRQRLAVLRQR